MQKDTAQTDGFGLFVVSLRLIFTNNATMKHKLFLVSGLLLLCLSCQNRTKAEAGKTPNDTCDVQPLLQVGAEPWAIFHNGKYYYTQGSENKIELWVTDDLNRLSEAKRQVVWQPTDPESSYHLWAPELHRIDNKWYIYFAADDGNMDNHQIYVIENSSPTPVEGQFVMKGRISTDADNNWAIHATTFEHLGQRYMLWSGWQQQRIDAETQCIYIARMENPWTLSGERVLISRPEYEWECQWVNPDGSKTAYPIHVNEAPQFFQRDKDGKLCIFYSASGSWTPYYCVGLLTAGPKADPLRPESWHKSPKPVLHQHPKQHIYGPGGISFVASPDGKEQYMLYHARIIANDKPGASDSRSPYLQKVECDAQGVPILELK